MSSETLAAAAGDPRLQRAGVPGAVGHRRQQPGGPQPDDAHLLQPRRPRQRRARVMVDGLSVGAALNGGGVSLLRARHDQLAGNAMNLSGGLGEAETGRRASSTSSRRRAATPSAAPPSPALAGKWSQGNNIDDRLRSFGLQDPPELVKNWDSSVSVGGPIKRTRCGSTATSASFGQHDTICGMYANKNAGDPTKWNYEKDLNVKARNAVARTITADARHRPGDAAEQDRPLLRQPAVVRRLVDAARGRGLPPGAATTGWRAAQATLAPEASSGSNGLLSARRLPQPLHRAWARPPGRRRSPTAAVRGRHLVASSTSGATSSRRARSGT